MYLCCGTIQNAFVIFVDYFLWLLWFVCATACIFDDKSITCFAVLWKLSDDDVTSLSYQEIMNFLNPVSIVIGKQGYSSKDMCVYHMQHSKMSLKEIDSLKILTVISLSTTESCLTVCFKMFYVKN